MSENDNIISIKRNQKAVLPILNLLDTGRPIGDAPDHICEERALIWDEKISLCVDGLFQSSDFISMEIAVNLIHEFRYDPSGFKVGKLKLLQGLLNDFGMTPRARKELLELWDEE